MKEMTGESKSNIDNLSEMSNYPDTIGCESKVSRFYVGCNILITGGSGFLGILLIERLLRCCPNLEKIYMFMRAKKEKSAEQRFSEFFDNVIYDRLRKINPNFTSKVIMIEADLSELDLALSPENRKRLLDTNVIFHGAANVRFMESIRSATNVNVRGTKQLLLLAKEMPNLKSFVYISTAFSYCIYKFIEEKYYPPPIETDKLLALLDILDDEKMEKLKSSIIGKWPNSYACTKAIAEDTVRQYSIDIPTCIVRPSIITSTDKEPVSGWINNVYGAVGIVMGSAMGLLRTLHCVPENIAEIVPADYVIAHTIVAAWDNSERKNTLPSIENARLHAAIPETERVPIYNYVSSCQNPIIWKKFMKLNEIYGMEVATTHCIWYYMFFLNRYLFVHNMCTIFLHMIPAAIVDTLAFLIGRKPILWKTYSKINKFSDVISHFSSQQWKFSNDAVVKLWDRLNSADRQIFEFNMHNLDWNAYLKNMIPGMRVYILNDPLDTVEKGLAKYKKLKIAHYTLLTVLAILFIWGIVSLTKFIVSFL